MIRVLGVIRAVSFKANHEIHETHETPRNAQRVISILRSAQIRSIRQIRVQKMSEQRSKKKRMSEKEQVKMKTPAIVSPEEWIAEWEKMLVKEKEFTRARDALAAERRRMPWTAVEKDYKFEGPN